MSQYVRIRFERWKFWWENTRAPCEPREADFQKTRSHKITIFVLENSKIPKKFAAKIRLQCLSAIIGELTLVGSCPPYADDVIEMTHNDWKSENWRLILSFFRNRFAKVDRGENNSEAKLSKRRHVPTNYNITLRILSCIYSCARQPLQGKMELNDYKTHLRYRTSPHLVFSFTIISTRWISTHGPMKLF